MSLGELVGFTVYPLGSRFDNADWNESVLKRTDLSKKLDRKEYDRRLSELQKKLRLLHGELYARRIPVDMHCL